MNYKTATAYILVINLILLILWDVIAEIYGGNESTISVTLWEWVDAYPGLAIAFGILLGHLFFSQHLPK